MADAKSNGEVMTAKKMLETHTKGYSGPGTTFPLRHFINVNRPIFYRGMYVPQMLSDPRVSFGVKLIKGPILSKAKFIVETQNEEVHDFLVRQIVRFWIKGAPISLDSIIYGFSGSEIIYKFNQEKQIIDFHKLKAIHASDVKPYVHIEKDELVAMEVSKIKHRAGAEGKTKVYVKKPKFFWSVHDRTYNRLYGRSRLEGAFVPWYEIWMQRGYRSIRQMWFYKNAYRSCLLRVPKGSTKDENGNEVANMKLAAEMADRFVTGSSLILPKEPDGQNDWEFEPAVGIPVPDGLLEYGEILGDEIWEGLGIPPEVVSADGTGAFAGRRIPQQAFYSVLQEIINEHIIDADEQIFQPLVNLNFGPVDYEINTISLLDTLQEEEMGLITGKSGDEDQKIEDRNSNPHNKNEETIKSNQE